MLKQGTGSADEYTVKFNTLITETDIKEEASQLNLYHQGINKPLMLKIYGMDPMLNTLQKWQEKVILFDSQLQQVQQFKAWRSGKTTTPPSSKTPKAKDPNAMDVGQFKLHKLTDKEHEWSRKEKGCFACQEVGHITKNCPKGKGKEKMHKIEEEPISETPSHHPSPPASVTSINSYEGSDGPSNSDHPPPYQGT